MKNANPVFRLPPWIRSPRATTGAGSGRGAARRACAALVIALAAGGALGGCAKEKAANMLTAAATNPRTSADFFPIKVGEKVVRMQLAVRPGEMQRGLMERRDLGRDDGMIFVYDKPQQMSFWMRNTPTPLDIGFFNAAGVLEEVYPLYPFDENAVASRSGELQFALEMNQGWFKDNGVKPGAQLDRKALADALRERGFNARKFGLAEGK